MRVQHGTTSKRKKSGGYGVIVALVLVMGWGAWTLKHQGNEQAAGILGVLTFFVVVGLGLSLLTRAAGRRTEAEAKLKADHPEEPWRWKEDWNAGEIKGGSRAEAWMLAGMGLVFIGLSAPGVGAIPREWREGNYLILLVLLFVLVGFGLLIAAWRRAWQYWRYGPLIFRPEPLPGSWGGFVGGVISIPQGVWLVGDVELKLRNLRLTQSGSGKNRRTTEAVRWETETTLDHTQLSTLDKLRELPVLFHVPRDKGQPCDEADPEDRTVWRLSVTMPVRGMRRALTTSWDVPVFDRGETLPPVKSGRVLLTAEKARSISHWLAVAGVSESREGGAWVWRFMQPRAWRGGVAMLGFALVFGLIGWFVPVTVLRVAFGGFALLLLALLPDLFWHRSELELKGREVVVRRRVWLRMKTWRVDREEIGDVIAEPSMRSGDEQFMRLHLVGIRGVDPKQAHPWEHFKARKARYRWQRELKKSGRASVQTEQALRETPRFELKVAGYLRGTHAAERVREHLLDQLTKSKP